MPATKSLAGILVAGLLLGFAVGFIASVLSYVGSALLNATRPLAEAAGSMGGQVRQAEAVVGNYTVVGGGPASGPYARVFDVLWAFASTVWALFGDPNVLAAMIAVALILAVLAGYARGY